MGSRLNLIRETLGEETTGGSSAARADGVVETLESGTASQVWLILAVLAKIGIPSSGEVTQFRRMIKLNGGAQALIDACRARSWDVRRVKIVSDDFFIQSPHSHLAHFGQAGLSAAAVTKRVLSNSDFAIARWTLGRRNLSINGELIVPWRSRFVLPGPLTDSRRPRSIAALSQFSESKSVAIGFGTEPLVTRTFRDLDAPGWAAHLASLQRFDAVCAIDAATRADLEGWKSMLGGLGIAGPSVVTISPPPPNAPGQAWREYARELFAC